MSGAVGGGRFTLDRQVWGSTDRGVWLGSGPREVLITLGPPAGHVDALDLPFVTPLIELCDGPGGLEALVESRPPGAIAAPLDGRALGAVVARACAGAVIGGLRPEAVWTDGDVVTLAPRATRFWELGRTDAGSVAASPLVYEAPERLQDAGPSHEDDVFALAATVVVWTTGEHPFAGDGHDQQVLSILGGRRRFDTGDPVLEAALGPAEGRPGMAELAGALES